MFHGAVVVGRKHESDANLLDAPGDALRAEVDIDTQGLQHIRAARLAAHTAPAVFAHLSACRCGHKHAAG